MRGTFEVTAYSGYVVLFDPAAVVLRGAEAPDLETLERRAAEGWLVFWPALEEYVTVEVAVDEPVTERLLEAVEETQRGALRVPGGSLWLSDPAFVHRAGEAPPPHSEDADVIAVTPGEYEATVYRLAWPEDAHDRYLKEAVGRAPVIARDWLAMAAFLLAAATAIGVPVFLVGRALADGLAGAGSGLAWAAAVLVPLWAVVLVGWRLPSLRAAGAAERRSVAVFPDAAVHLARREG